MARRILATVMAILMTAAGAPAWAADCGDTAGAGGTRVACDCGDSVVTSTGLRPADPVVTGVCGGVGLSIGTDGITLDCNGLEINGDPNDDGIVLDGRTGATVRNCLVTGFIDGIQLLASSGNTIVLNTISGSDDVGIDLEESSNNVIKANRVVAAGNDAINLSSSSSGNFIENNVLDAAGVSEEDGVDFDCCGVSGNTVKGNQITGFDDSGIEIEEENDGNVVTENRVTGSGDDGIEVDSDFNTIARNLVEGSGGDGIDVSGDFNVVDTNRMKGNGDDGLDVSGSDNTVIRNVGDNNADIGICVAPGNTDGGGNRGSGNGTANVDLACL